MATLIMSMRYLLISPPKKGIKLFIESPCVGLGYLATAIRKLGHEVKIIDCIVEDLDNYQTVVEVVKYRPDIVGINLFSTALSSVKDLVGKIKYLQDDRDPEFKPMIILGGPHCSGSPEHTLKYFPEADYAFRGECEIPIKEFDEFLQGKRLEGDVTGLIWRQGTSIVANPPIEYRNIEEFGMPAWDLIDPRKYFKQVNVGDKSINVHFSRGCPFSCKFCVKLGNKVRLRSIEHIWEELEYLNKEFGVERFIINDEGYTMLPAFVKKFCRMALSKGNRFTFFTATGMRLNRLDSEMLELMKEARHELAFGVGIESGVPRVRQDLMNKQLTQEEILNGLYLLNKHGFKPFGNFIMGFPGETKEELKESVNLACKLFDRGLLVGASFVNFIPLPGSPIVNEMLKSGELSEDFDFSKMNLGVVCYAPKGSTIKEMDKLRRWAVWKMNTRPKLLWHYLSNWGHFKRAIISFIRIYTPNFLLPKDWRRL